MGHNQPDTAVADIEPEVTSVVEPEVTDETADASSIAGSAAIAAPPTDPAVEVLQRFVRPSPPSRAVDEIELSVLIPVFNEEAAVQRLVLRVLDAPYRKQVIIVDDGSTDGTMQKLARFRGLDGVEIVQHERNLGKGSAIRTALGRAVGRYTIIQDADLEYDPEDYPKLVEYLKQSGDRVVYGSRYLGENSIPFTRFRFAVHLLNCIVRVFYGATLTDEATCYKAFDTKLLRELNLRCERFEFCPEVTAKILKRGLPIHELPIRFNRRTTAEGKKIGWYDGFEAIWTLIRYRFCS